ncbi:acyl-CoA reductase [Pantoea rodasii]|uniref:Acyl-CoA reductase n=1 Tax=Pantoea rodasii TaxID=1076549 RepID=A0A2M9WHA3_9GAMM|nr:acyl-CoA reductase [Pantoea rodasii]ORM61963.1 acyl-CoA reductase [Pantoea rodasii]PJZ06941.1 acyl-CoA reductase [Pantoea rodasii]
MKEIAGYLPGCLSPADVQWRTLSFSHHGQHLDVDVPDLNSAQIAAVSAHVRDHARAYLKTLSVAKIVAIIDQAIARLLDRSHPLRRKAETLLPIVTGYDAEMIRLGLTGYLKTFRQPQLKRFLAEDFNDPQLLDDFQPRANGGFARAFGPDLLLHIWAGNVPGLPLWSLICGLLVKAGTVGKLPGAEPLMAGWFAQLLAEIDPQLGECMAVVWWKGGDAETEKHWFTQPDVVMAYGGNAALAAIKQQLPVTTRFLPHGHKISVGLVARSALDTRQGVDLAHRVAYDVMRYDQAGCYSPQMLFIERGGRITPQEIAEYIAHELRALGHKYPRRALSSSEVNSVAAWRSREEVRALQGDRILFGDPSDGWAVVIVDGPEALTPSALGRTLKVVAVDEIDDAIALMAQQKIYLQTAAVAAEPQELFHLATRLGQAGITRITAFGSMTSPAAGWHHDGRFSLLDLVTITEIEASAETAAERYAPYAD